MKNRRSRREDNDTMDPSMWTPWERKLYGGEPEGNREGNNTAHPKEPRGQIEGPPDGPSGVGKESQRGAPNGESDGEHVDNFGAKVPYNDNLVGGEPAGVHGGGRHRPGVYTYGPGQRQMLTVQSVSSHADPPPTCPILQTAGEEDMANWQNELVDYDYRVTQ